MGVQDGGRMWVRLGSEGANQLHRKKTEKGATKNAKGTETDSPGI
jgi:hypothetical protein